MMVRLCRLLIVAVIAVACVITYVRLREQKSRAAQHELSLLAPKIAAVTIYDLFHHDPSDSQSLTRAISARFPEDVFTRAALSAQHQNGSPIWKGSALAILRLRDGSERRAHFSYYGDFFTLEGTPGRFVCPDTAGFHETFFRVINQEFVPQREARNQKKRDPKNED